VQLLDGEETLGWYDFERAEDSRAELLEMEVVDDGGQSEINRRRRELDEIRARYGYCGRSLDAFHRLCKAYRDVGRSIDELRYYEPDEVKRFFGYVISGADGHAFWNGGQRDFTLNAVDGVTRSRAPVHWWWTHIYGERAYRLVTCETPGCISPYHARKEDKRERKRLFPDHAIIGAIQVWALRHGHSPGADEWTRAGMTPSKTTIGNRFGSFDNAVIAAGLTPKPRHNRPVSADIVLEHLYLVAKEMGRWPDHDSYRNAAVGRYVTPTTIRHYFGGFVAARAAAKARYSL
jgi:hypothetical protein